MKYHQMHYHIHTSTHHQWVNIFFSVQRQMYHLLCIIKLLNRLKATPKCCSNFTCDGIQFRMLFVSVCVHYKICWTFPTFIKCCKVNTIYFCSMAKLQQNNTFIEKCLCILKRPFDVHCAYKKANTWVCEWNICEFFLFFFFGLKRVCDNDRPIF